MHQTRFAMAAAAAVVLLCFVPVDMPAQSTYATITGAATDPAGALMAGVSIEAVQIETNYKHTVRTNDAGQYTLANIREGMYRLTAKAVGFQDLVMDNIVVAARDLRRIDLHMILGNLQSKIEVTAEAAQIETETGRISDVKSGDYMRTLATTSRGGWYYLQLVPDAVKARQGTWEMRFGGARSFQSQQTMDGIDLGSGSQNNTSQQAMTLSTARLESIQELRIDTAGNSAEYRGIGQAEFVTRSGGNDLHGSAYWIYGTPMLQARNPFSLARTATVGHWLGVSGGGPVYLPKIYDGRNKTFFYFSKEWTQGSPTRVLLNPTVPLPAWRSGDYSGLLPGTVIKDPLASNTPFPGNRIPAARLNPAALAFQDLYPLPNMGNAGQLQSQNYRDTLNFVRFGLPDYVGRIDHRFSERAAVFGRIFITDQRAQSGNATPFPSLYNLIYNDRLAMTAVLSYTHTLRPNLLNEFRWGYGRQRLNIINNMPGPQLAKQLNLLGLAPNPQNIGGITNISFSGLGLTGVNANGTALPNEEYLHATIEDHVSWFKGRHALKVGAQFSRPTTEMRGSGTSLYGALTFSNRFTGFPYADFQLGIPTTATRTYPPLANMAKRLAQGYFATDEFRISQKLTLTFGIRCDYMAPWRQAGGLISGFDLQTGKIVVPDQAISQVNPLMPKQYVDVTKASSAGYDAATLVGGDRNNLAPRAALAWRPLGPNTVFRAAYGFFYDVVPFRAGAAAGVPFNIAEPAFTNPTDKPSVILPRVFPDSSSGPATVGIPQAIRSDLRVPYSMQSTATIEHQRWDMGFRLSYVGTNTRQGVWNYNINQPVADSRAFIDKPRLFPQYPGIAYFTNGAGHQYNSGTIAVQSRRARKGLDFQVYYSLSRDIGDLESAEAPENAYDRKRERAVWEDVPTHRLAGNFKYQIPVGRGRAILPGVNRWVNAALGGWDLGGVYTRSTGQFLTPLWTGSDPTGTAYTTSRTPALVTIRPNILRDANLSNPTPKQWFDVSAFTSPTPGSFGTSAKGVIKGPGDNLINLSISKLFSIRDRARLRLQVDASNAFNHPNYSNPGLNVTQNAAAAVITAVANPSFNLDNAGQRQVNLHLRVEW